LSLFFNCHNQVESLYSALSVLDALNHSIEETKVHHLIKQNLLEVSCLNLKGVVKGKPTKETSKGSFNSITSCKEGKTKVVLTAKETGIKKEKNNINNNIFLSINLLLSDIKPKKQNHTKHQNTIN